MCLCVCLSVCVSEYVCLCRPCARRGKDHIMWSGVEGEREGGRGYARSSRLLLSGAYAPTKKKSGTLHSKIKLV